jgi:hypothetical protein
MIRRGASLFVSLLAIVLGGCAQTNADIPSLSRRPIEGIDKAEADAPPAPQAPASNAGAARLAAIDARIRAADSAFRMAAAAARTQIGAAGPAGSESWVAAQEALSTAAAAQADMTSAISDLDAFSRELVVSADPSAGADLVAASTLTARAVELQSDQAKISAELGGKLAAP